MYPCQDSTHTLARATTSWDHNLCCPPQCASGVQHARNTRYATPKTHEASQHALSDIMHTHVAHHDDRTQPPHASTAANPTQELPMANPMPLCRLTPVRCHCSQPHMSLVVLSSFSFHLLPNQKAWIPSIDQMQGVPRRRATTLPEAPHGIGLFVRLLERWIYLLLLLCRRIHLFLSFPRASIYWRVREHG